MRSKRRPPGSLILVLGPTGVGKTTLRRKVEESLTEKLMTLMEEIRDVFQF